MQRLGKIKKPEPAPRFDEFNDEMNKIVNLAVSNDFKDTIKDANSEYLYWDKFKHLKQPNEINPKLAWLALKIIRGSATKTIPLIWSKGIAFSYWLPDIALKSLHFIDQNASGNILVEEPNIQRKEKKHYLMNSIIEEAIASSILEGAVTTRKKAKEMLKKGRQPRDKAEQMIFNNYYTISRIKELISEELSPSLLEKLQESITKDTLENPDYEGRFRDINDETIEVTDSSGQVLHDPPPASEVRKSIDQLCDFVNTEDKDDFIHPVLKGIILHFWLAFIHPFMDGNGRTARALFYWYLLKKKYWLFEFLSISRIILKAPAQYYRAFLYSEIDDGDMTYFIRFHLRAINLAVKELQQYLERKQKEILIIARRLISYPDLNYRQKALLSHALSHPDASFTPRSHRQAHRVVYETARNDLLGLVERGFLEKVKLGRGFSFVPAEGLDQKIGE